MSEQRRWLRWWDYAIALGIAALYVVLLLNTVGTLGYARDEGFYFSAAESYGRWFELLVRAPKEALTRAAVDRAWSINHEHPALAKSAFALSWLLLHKKWHLFPMEGTAFRFRGCSARDWCCSSCICGGRERGRGPRGSPRRWGSR